MCFLEPCSSVFSRKNWKHFAFALRCCPIRMCLPAVCFVSSFRMTVASGDLRCTTRRWSCFRRLLWQLLYLRGIKWRFQQLLRATRLRVQTSLQPLWPSRFLFLFFFGQSASLVSSLFLRAENLTTRSPAWLFPQFQRCFPPYFQLRLGSYQLAFLSYRYVEIAAIS